MDITVRHTDTGRSCVIQLSDTATVLELKAASLHALFGAEVDADTEASRLVARLQGSEAVVGDADRLSCTGLEAGGAVDVARHHCIRPATYPSTDVRCIAVSACGSLCAHGTLWGEVVVFDTQTAKRVAQMHHTYVHCIAFSRCGVWMATCHSSVVCVYRVQPSSASWDRVHTLEGHSGVVFCAAWSPCGLLVSGSGDTTLRVWDVGGGTCESVIQAETCVRGCAVSGDVIFSGGNDHAVRAWGLHSGQQLRAMQGHTEGVRDVKLAEDGSLLASCSGCSVRVWCPASFVCVCCLVASVPLVRVCVSSGRGVVLAQTTATHVASWCLRSTSRLKDMPCSGQRLGLALSPCGRWVFSPGIEGVGVVQLAGE